MRFIKSAEEIKNEPIVQSDYIDQFGNVCSEEKACAKKQSSPAGMKHFIMQSISQRKVFNPIIDDSSKKLPGRTEKDFTLVETSKDAYEFYVEFLRTKNPTFLKRAEIATKR
jgi:hypothetical protein